MMWRCLIIVFIVTLSLVAADVKAGTIAIDRPQKPIYKKCLWFRSWVTSTIELRNVSDGADPVLRVHLPGTEGVWTNEGGPGQAEILSVSLLPGIFCRDVIVHSTSSRTEGIAELWINNVFVETITFGGASTGHLQGTTDMKVFAGHLAGGYEKLQFIVTKCGSDMTALGPLIENENPLAGSNQAYFYPSVSTCVRVFFSGYSPLIVNHVDDPLYKPGLALYTSYDNLDNDGDGLDFQLEDALKTCDTDAPNSIQLTTGWPCDTYSSLDSDGDGIPDYDEVAGACTSSDDCLALALWGADPAQKDAFWEIDTSDAIDPIRFGTTGKRAGEGTSPNQLKQLAQAYLAGDESFVKNPNRLNGIRVHLDMDGATELSNFSIDGNPVVVFDSPNSEWLSSEVDDCPVWDRVTRSQTQLSRRYFRYACESIESSGTYSPTTQTLRFEKSLWSTLAHEMGHSLGLTHGGESDKNNTAVHRISMMSYAYQDKRFIFSQGLRPNAQGVLQYAINPMQLCEEHPFHDPDVSGNVIDFTQQQDKGGRNWVPQRYKVYPSGAVDWNRDGTINPCDQPVEAPLRWNTAGSAQNHSGWRSQEVLTYNLESQQYIGASSIVYAKGSEFENVYIFYVKDVTGNGDYRLAWRWIPFTNKMCPSPVVESNGNHGDCGNFSQEHVTGYPASSVDATFINGSIYVVSRYQNNSPNDGRVVVRKFRPSRLGTGISSHQSLSWASSGKARGRPVAIRDPQTQDLSVFFVNEANSAIHYLYYHADVIVSSGPLEGEERYDSATDIGITVNLHDGNIYIAYAESSPGKIKLIRREPRLADNHWSDSHSYTLPLDNRYNVNTTMSVAWRPNSLNSPSGQGAFWFMYGSHSNRAIWMMRFDGSVDPTRLVAGSRRHHTDRIDLDKLGVDLEFVEGFGVMGVEHYRKAGESVGRIRFLPYAVEIMSVDLMDSNDFENMKICGYLSKQWRDQGLSHPGCGTTNR